MPYHLAREPRHIVRGGVVALRGQAGGVDVAGIVHAQLGGAAVHRRHHALLRAVQVLAQRDRGIVGAAHYDRLEQLAQLVGGARVQQRLRAAHAARARAGRHVVVQRAAPVLYRLQYQQYGHELGHAGHRTALRGVLLIYHAPGGRLHQQRALAGQRKRNRVLQRQALARFPRARAHYRAVCAHHGQHSRQQQHAQYRHKPFRHAHPSRKHVYYSLQRVHPQYYPARKKAPRRLRRNISEICIIMRECGIVRMRK